MNQTENPKKRESSSQEKQENENWGDQLSNNNFGPDQDYNDNDQNKNDDAVEIMNTIEDNDLLPNQSAILVDMQESIISVGIGTFTVNETSLMIGK